MNDVVERMAKAIDPDGWSEEPDPDSPYKEYNRLLAQTNDIQRKQARQKARAVLKVLHEPTKEMVETGHAQSHRMAEYEPVHSLSDLHIIFQAMVDELLKEAETL